MTERVGQGKYLPVRSQHFPDKRRPVFHRKYNGIEPRRPGFYSIKAGKPLGSVPAGSKQSGRGKKIGPLPAREAIAITQKSHPAVQSAQAIKLQGHVG
jgi:hypothetical protein